METGKTDINEKVDRELKKLEQRYKAGNENTYLYKLKVENLNLVKEVANIGKKKKQGLKEWEKQTG